MKITKGPLWAGVISGAIMQTADTLALYNGKIEKKDYAVSTLGNVSSSLGLIAGIEYGATLGTMVLPGAGTAIGSIAGGIIGDIAGRYIGHRTGGLFSNKQNINVTGENVTVTNEIHYENPPIDSHTLQEQEKNPNYPPNFKGI